MENFLVKFQLKVNKARASGTVLSERVLGYILLNSANLPEEKHYVVKAMCDELNFKNVIAQLKKIGFSKSIKNSRNFVLEPRTSKLKIEERVFYTENKSTVYRKFKTKPTNQFGHVLRACSFCNCLYHWLVDCPYASNSLKKNLTSSSKSHKSLLTDGKRNCYDISLYTDTDPSQLCLLVGETLGQAIVDTGCPFTVAGDTWLKSYINTLSRKDQQ